MEGGLLALPLVTAFGSRRRCASLPGGLEPFALLRPADGEAEGWERDRARVPADTGAVCFEQCDSVPLLPVAGSKAVDQERNKLRGAGWTQHEVLRVVDGGARAVGPAEGTAGRDGGEMGRSPWCGGSSSPPPQALHWPWVPVKKVLRAISPRPQEKEPYIMFPSFAICFPQNRGSIGWWERTCPVPGPTRGTAQAAPS